MAQLAIIAILLFQVSQVLHLHEHDADHVSVSCAACVQYDESDEFLVPAADQARLLSTQSPAVTKPSDLTVSTRQSAYRSRAPPQS